MSLIMDLNPKVKFPVEDLIEFLGPEGKDFLKMYEEFDSKRKEGVESDDFNEFLEEEIDYQTDPPSSDDSESTQDDEDVLS